ncbi:MAG: hypothetical protein LBN20_06635 [Endomicrobium sp.]|jgi:hypothetical protein|nr:hypothetical protein [Endomicrobium sp.]
MNKEQIEKTFENGGGILRLLPTFVPRPAGKTGGRLKLHQDDIFAFGMNRGSIKERWLASTVLANNGSLTTPNEGLSFVSVDYKSDEKFSFKDAMDFLGERLIGKQLKQKYGQFPVFAKFFDYVTPLFFHTHLDFEHAALIGRFGKPEAYFFPRQLNNHGGDFPLTYFGFDPSVKPEQVKECLRNFTVGDNKITELSRAFRLELDTGWFTPMGIAHAPGSYLTYEPQWCADVTSVFENYTAGNVNPIEKLNSVIIEEKKNDIDYIFDLLDWQANIDPDYKKKYFRPPIIESSDSAAELKWISYANEYFCAKEITVFPEQTFILKDDFAFGAIFIEGHGKFGNYYCESPTMLRFGQQSSDEFFVSQDAAKKGIKIVNTSPVEPLVALLHFGPDNNKAPKNPPQNIYKKEED